MTVIGVAAGLRTGILSGFGIGGGSLLLLYLTLFAGVDQYRAADQPAVLYRLRPRRAVSAYQKRAGAEGRGQVVAAGVLTSIAAALAAARMDTGWLRQAFGVFLLYIGAKRAVYKAETIGNGGKITPSNRITNKGKGGCPDMKRRGFLCCLRWSCCWRWTACGASVARTLPATSAAEDNNAGWTEARPRRRRAAGQLILPRCGKTQSSSCPRI